jgi:putative ABC transport system permease protein
MGIAIGVSVALSLYIIEKSINEDVHNRYSPDFFEAPIVLLSPGNMLNEENINKWLSPLSERLRYSGYLNQSVWLKTNDGQSQITAIGMDFLSDIDEKSKKINLEFKEDELSFMNSQTAVAFSSQQLQKWGKDHNSNIQIITKNGIKQLTIEAEIKRGSKFSDAAVFYIGTMQKIMALDNRYDGVFVWSKHNETIDQLKQLLENVLPNGVQIRVLSERSTDYESLLTSFQNSIKYIRWLALLIAILTTSNSMSFSMNFRRKDIAILRCLGYNKFNIAIIVGLEALFLGTIGSLLGIALGIIISYSSIELVGSLVSANFIAVNPVVNIDLGNKYFIVFFAGLFAVILGMAGPIITALSRDPILDIYPSETIKFYKFNLNKLIFIEVLLLGIIWILPVPVLIKGMISILFLYIFLLTIFPNLISGLQKLILFIARNKNLALQVSIRNVNRNSWRVLLSALGLSASTSTAIIVVILVSSFRYSVNDWLKGITADYIITLGSQITGPTLSTLDAGWINKFEKVPGVRGALGFRQNVTKIHNGTGNVIKIYRYEYERYGELYTRPEAKKGNITSCAHKMVSGNYVTISEALAFKENIRLDDPFGIITPSGTVNVRACAISTDYGSENGVIIADKNFYKKYWDDSYVDFVEIFTPSEAKDFQSQMLDRLNLDATPAGLYVTSNADYHKNLGNLLNSTFSLTYASLIVAGAISFMNLVITIWVFAIERRKEYSILRALGATTSSSLRILAWEGFWITLLGTIIGVTIGGFMSMFMLKHEIQGWELLIDIPYFFIAFIILIIPSLGFVLSYYPAKMVINELPIYQTLSKE